MSQLPPCLVGLEACCSAHYWAHKIERLGHRVRLMSPRFVKPYRKSDKNDANDAEAIWEAVTRARCASFRSRAKHSTRFRRCTGYVSNCSRAALHNPVRGLLAEHGIVAPLGIARARRLLLEILADPERHGLSGLFRETLQEMGKRLRFFDERVGASMTESSEHLKKMSAVEGSPRSKDWVRWLPPL
jgi:transposase